MEQWKVQCSHCEKTWTEEYPGGLSGNESYSTFDTKCCECYGQHDLIERVC